MLIDDERLETALKRLAKSDALVAELHMKAERAEFKAKATKDAIFLRSEGNVAERNALAGIHEDYAKAMDDYFTALQAHDTLKNERSREVIIIECWRSMNSTRNKGLIT
ncbi:MAG TPA: hypothetical protein VN879_16000 [Candidatus Acidoferrales bacterium]|nr:hypothetical protein [Candidatus Acidoferrales bacterium]